MGAAPSQMFDAGLLKELDYSKASVSLPTNTDASNCNNENLKMRPLARADFDKGYLELLKQLTEVGEITREAFEARFDEMVGVKDTYYVAVVEDTTTGRVVACGTLLVEKKYIHQCAKRGHIEDIVVDDMYRGKQLGKIVVETLKLLSEHVGCYKVTLDCAKTNVGFYEKCGFSFDEVHFMWCRFPPKH